MQCASESLRNRKGRTYSGKCAVPLQEEGDSARIGAMTRQRTIGVKDVVDNGNVTTWVCPASVRSPFILFRFGPSP